jgi:putative membrane protein
MSMTRTHFAALVLSVAATVPLAAQSSAGSKTMQSAPSPKMTKMTTTSAKGDAAFVTTAATAGMKEVDVAKIAETKASSADVKRFAQQLDTDHSKANEELKGLAQTKSIPLPTGDTAYKAAVTKLNNTPASQFDKAYVDAQVMDHQQAVALFQKESTSGTDAELKAFAAKTLPTLREHLRMAQELRTKLAGSSK